MTNRRPMRVRLIPWVFATSFAGLAMLFQSLTHWDHASYRDDYSPPLGISVPIDQQSHMESFAQLYLRRLHVIKPTEHEGFEVPDSLSSALLINVVAAAVM